MCLFHPHQLKSKRLEVGLNEFLLNILSNVVFVYSELIPLKKVIEMVQVLNLTLMGVAWIMVTFILFQLMDTLHTDNAQTIRDFLTITKIECCQAYPSDLTLIILPCQEEDFLTKKTMISRRLGGKKTACRINQPASKQQKVVPALATTEQVFSVSCSRRLQQDAFLHFS